MRQYVKECITCHQCKSRSGLQKPWQELPPVNKPMERISIDITDMETRAHGYRYVLTVVDHYSILTKFYKLRTRNTGEVCMNSRNCVYNFGIPGTLLLVKAKEFTSQCWHLDNILGRFID